MSTSDRVQTDIKKLKQKYNVQLSSLKELFSEWTEEDLLFTLQDTDGDLDLAIDRISEGNNKLCLLLHYSEFPRSCKSMG